MIRRPPRSTLFPPRPSSDLAAPAGAPLPRSRDRQAAAATAPSRWRGTRRTRCLCPRRRRAAGSGRSRAVRRRGLRCTPPPPGRWPPTRARRFRWPPPVRRRGARPAGRRRPPATTVAAGASRADALGGEPVLHFGPVRRERGLTARLEWHDQDRVGVRRAQQPPPVGEGDAYAVQRRHGIPGGEVLRRALHDRELALVRAINTDLRARDGRREIGERAGERPLLTG